MEDRIRQLSSTDQEVSLAAARGYYEQLTTDERLSEEERQEAAEILSALNNPNDPKNKDIIENGINGAIRHSRESVTESQQILYHNHKVEDTETYVKGVVDAAKRRVETEHVEPITVAQQKGLETYSRNSYDRFKIAEQERLRTASEIDRERAAIAGLEFPKVTKLGAELAASYWAKEISKIETTLADIKLRESLSQKAEQETQARSNKRIVCQAIAGNLTEEQNKLPDNVKEKLKEDADKAEPILSEGMEGKTVKINGKDVPLMDENGVINTQAVDQYLQEHGIDALVMTEVVRRTVGKVGSLEDDGSGLEQLQARTESLEQTEEGLVPAMEDEATGKRRAITLRDYVLHTRAQGLFDQQALEQEAESIAEEPAEEQKIDKAKASVAARTGGMVTTAAQQRQAATATAGGAPRPMGA